MPGVFDRLQKQIDDKQKQGGISAIDLLDLPPALKRIMRIMLREVQMTHGRILEVLEGLPAEQRMAQPELEQALQTLADQAWLIRIGEGERAIYKVNVRRKAGSTLAPGIWDKLDEKLKGNPE
jgi:hypothetical protein